jgi:hypothetical protein
MIFTDIEELHRRCERDEGDFPFSSGDFMTWCSEFTLDDGTRNLWITSSFVTRVADGKVFLQCKHIRYSNGTVELEDSYRNSIGNESITRYVDGIERNNRRHPSTLYELVLFVRDER